MRLDTSVLIVTPGAASHRVASAGGLHATRISCDQRTNGQPAFNTAKLTV